MTPYETTLLVLNFALLSTLNAVSQATRWLSFACLSFAVLGVTGLVEVAPSYDLFFTFGPPTMILFVVAALYGRFFQKVILPLIGTALLFGMIVLQTSPQGYYDRALLLLVLFVVAALYPALLGSVEDDEWGRVESLISIQQMWVRIGFVTWCRENLVNIQHYELSEELIAALTTVAAIVLLIGVLWRRRSWFLSAKAFLSLGVLVGGLSLDASALKLLLSWILLVGFLDLLPRVKDIKAQNLIRRFGLGACGGAVFWGLLFVVENSALDFEWKLAWVGLVISMGLLALVLPYPGERPEGGGKILVAIGFGAQAVTLATLLYWPSVGG